MWSDRGGARRKGAAAMATGMRATDNDAEATRAAFYQLCRGAFSQGARPAAAAATAPAAAAAAGKVAYGAPATPTAASTVTRRGRAPHSAWTEESSQPDPNEIRVAFSALYAQTFGDAAVVGGACGAHLRPRGRPSGPQPPLGSDRRSTHAQKQAETHVPARYPTPTSSESDHIRIIDDDEEEEPNEREHDSGGKMAPRGDAAQRPRAATRARASGQWRPAKRPKRALAPPASPKKSSAHFDRDTADNSVCAVCFEAIERDDAGVSVGAGGGAHAAVPPGDRRTTRSSSSSLVSTLPVCGHSFHRRCAHEWLRRQNTCPVCRVRVSSLDGVALVDRDQVVWDAEAAAAEAAQLQAAGQPIEAAQLLNLDQVVCSICGSGGHEGSLLLCDGCEAGAAHVACVGLDHVPEEAWYCGVCMSERRWQPRRGAPG